MSHASSRVSSLSLVQRQMRRFPRLLLAVTLTGARRKELNRGLIRGIG